MNSVKLIQCFLFLAKLAGQGIDLAMQVNGDVTTFSFRQIVALLLQSIGKTLFAVRYRPAFLQFTLDVGRLWANAYSLLLFGAGIVKRVLAAFVPKPVRLLPAVFQIERFGYFVQLDLGVQDIDGFHFLVINPAPDTVSVMAAFLLMENDNRRRTFQSEFLLNLIQRGLERVDGNPLVLWRVQAQGVHELLALGSLR